MAEALFKFILKSGTFREEVRVDHSKLSLLYLTNLASEFIRKHYPENGLGDRLGDHLLLYRHDFSSINVLQLINNIQDIQEGTLIEAVISGNPLSERLIVHPHCLLVHSFRSPTFCDFCGELLFGIFKQGLKCDLCSLNCHKRCALKVPNNCRGNGGRRRTSVIALNRVSFNGSPIGEAVLTSTPNQSGLLKTTQNQEHHSPMRMTQSSAQLANGAPSIMVTPDEGTGYQHWSDDSFPSGGRDKRSSSWSGRPLWMELSEVTQIKVPHTFQAHTYKIPTLCQVCRKLLKGLIRQGYQCKDCDFNCHKKCQSKAPKNCSCSITRSPSFYMNGDDNMTESGFGSLELSAVKADILSPSPTANQRRGSFDTAKQRREKGRDTVVKGSAVLMAEDSIETEGYVEIDAEEEIENVPVMRVCAGKMPPRGSELNTIKSGWLVHFTDKNAMRRKHFWRLTIEHLILYYDDKTKQFFKKISLSDILVVRLLISSDERKVEHYLEMRTNACVFYICSSGVGERGRVLKNLNSWEQAIGYAVMPIGPCLNQDSKTTKVLESRPSLLGEEIQSEEAFSQVYQIFTNEELGAGCFGRVFAGVHRMKRHEVAIKVIEKKKFPKAKEKDLRAEVDILKKLRHPGIVSFEEMMETETRIFVVMEKMGGGDLLEMLIHSEDKKFSERTSKFFIYQTLVALKYLHDQNIAHCDMKPENILLESDSDFPQTKLCDFGYARIIGDNGFKHSMVGTMAYLAPEVLKHKKFNRALDMWSTGVVTYVCLSGTFPFDDNSDLVEQIKDWEMGDDIFKEKRWKNVSDLAKSFVGSLLDVNVQTRSDVNKALQHKWLQNYTLWSDLRILEQSLRQRYLTRPEDDAQWKKYEKTLRMESNCKQDQSCTVPGINETFTVPNQL